MSTRQVERLEALLALVQRNRVAKRGDNGAERVQHAPAVARKTPAELAAPVAAPPPPPPQPAAAAPAQPARAKPAPTPLEMALEGRASGGGGIAPALRGGAMSDGGVAGQPERPAPAAAPPAAAPTEGRVLAEPSTTEPTKPIVQVVSKQPPVAAASFGELLKRSLSLRPR